MALNPAYRTLLALKGRSLTCAIEARSPAKGSADCQEQSVSAALNGGDGLTISKATDGGGVWVPYMPSTVFYGWSGAGSTWMGSGPFSGCHIAFFTDGARVGMAHIPKPAVSGSDEAWEAFSKKGGITVLNEWKVPLPSETRYSASYVFLDLSDPSHLGMSRVDVHVTAMGGANGTIFDVSRLL